MSVVNDYYLHIHHAASTQWHTLSAIHEDPSEGWTLGSDQTRLQSKHTIPIWQSPSEFSEKSRRAVPGTRLQNPSAFIGHENPKTHRILAAGDLNIAHGYGDGGDPYWEARYRSVFERMGVVGLEFIGPQAPHGRQAETPATGEPADSRNVVTYYLPGKNPATASNNQLDYVFASRGFHEGITVRAMNSVEEWGASDHCRPLIRIADGQRRCQAAGRREQGQV